MSTVATVATETAVINSNNNTEIPRMTVMETEAVVAEEEDMLGPGEITHTIAATIPNGHNSNGTTLPIMAVAAVNNNSSSSHRHAHR